MSAETPEQAVTGPGGDCGSVQAFLGDGHDDVVQIPLEPPIGTPLALPDGRILLWYTARKDDAQYALARISDDDGRTWGDPRVLFRFPRNGGTFGKGASLVSQKGTIHLFGLDYYNFDFHNRLRSKSLLWHARSLDGAESWEDVQYVDFGLKYTGASNNAFQLKSRRIIVPVSALSDRRIGAFVSLTPFSDDDGKTWNRPGEQIAVGTGASDWYESGAAEPVGVELNDGRVWLLPRSQDGYQWETFSEDAGIHWSPPRHTRFVSNQSAMAIMRLRDGRLVLLWNNCGAEGLGEVHWGNAERAIIAAALSSDEGMTWVGYREVARVTDNRQVSYPYITETKSGHILLSAAEFFMRIDPNFLMGTTVVEDFSHGLRRWSTLGTRGATAVADPEGKGGAALWMAKPDPSMPSGACLNFPFGGSGRVTASIRIEEGFQGAHFTLTDHYDLPGLPRDGSFPFRILASGRIEIIGSGSNWLATPGDLTHGRLHDLRLEWSCSSSEAVLFLDEAEVARLHQYICAEGMCYFRLRSLARDVDEKGVYLERLRVDVGP